MQKECQLGVIEKWPTFEVLRKSGSAAEAANQGRLMNSEFSDCALANFRGVFDASLRDLDYLGRDQFRERVVAVLDAKSGQRLLISSRQRSATAGLS
jgi:hypothetical protein